MSQQTEDARQIKIVRILNPHPTRESDTNTALRIAQMNALARMERDARVDTLIAELQLALSSFRQRLKDAAYPFAEPPGVTRLLAESDRHLFPEEVEKQRARKTS